MSENPVDKQEKKDVFQYDIVIDLSQSFNAIAYDAQNIIQQFEFNRVKNWIAKRIAFVSDLNNLSENSNKRINQRYNDTISVLGTRGSGKTSFLLSVKDYCQNKEKEIEVLPMIDPTLIEEKGHVFLTILSLIKDCVERKLYKSDATPLSDTYSKEKEWRNKLKSLADGIPSVDGIGGGLESWTDSEFIMDKGLREVKAAKNLEQDFRELVKLGLDILGKKVFLLTLDDIDINFRRGWVVLETVRKYLTTPYIITMISGDVRLYAKAIRKQQWNNFGKALLINEGDKLGRLKEYDNLVTEMESQYMQKILQPQYRLQLKTLKDILKISETRVQIEISQNQKSSIVDYYNDKLKGIGIYNIAQAESYRSYLLSLPIRTQVAFLKEDDSLNYVNPFLSDLYNKKVNVDLIQSSPQYLNIEILDFLVREQILNESYQLQPILTDNSIDSTLFALSALFSHQIQDNPYLIFDYFVRIGYMRNLLQLFPYEDKDDNTEKMPMEKFCRYCNIMQDTTLRDISCLMAACTRAKLNPNKSSWGSMVGLQGLKYKQHVSKDDLKDRIDSVFKEKTLWMQQIAFMPVSISKDSTRNSSYVTYSFYTLLASICDISRAYHNVEDINDELITVSQIRSFSMPNFKKGNFSGDEPIDIDFPENQNKEHYEEWINLITEWINKFSKQTISPHLLGKISTRLYFAMHDIDDGNNLGDSMHRRMVVFFNAILIEDVREHNLMNILKLSNDNPVGDDKLFVNNLNKIIDNSKFSKDLDKKIDINQLAFSRWMLSCPLLTAYLNLKKLVSGSIGLEKREDMSLGKLLNIFLNEELNQDFNIYQDLEGVLLNDTNNNTSTKNLISFSYARNRWKPVLKILRKYYPSPSEFNNETNEGIREKLKGVFKDKSVTDDRINHIKEYHKNESTWLEKLPNVIDGGHADNR